MSKTLTAGFALIAGLVMVAVGYVILRPPGALLSNARFDKTQISPNADGVDDITTVYYSLSRPAQVSIYLENPAGDRYYFRQNERRTTGDFSVYFSGIVDGYMLPGEAITGAIERRLVPDDRYTWVIEAVRDGDTERAAGTLEIAGGDIALPTMATFDINPTVFTPNQDGIRDRTNINIYLEKPADLNVYLEGSDTQRYYLIEREGG
ncbi:MAG: hypothetical protein EHM39_12545, partial [Chloroflexi bacterium]